MKRSPALFGLLGALLGSAVATSAFAGTLFSDGFDANKGWPDSDTSNDTEAVYAIVNGEYLINPLRNNTYALAISPALVPGADVVVESDLRLAASLPESRAGVACRIGAGLNFYAFALAAKGTFEIVRVQNGKGTLLASGPLGVDASQGVRMRAECVGSSLALQVNGRELGRASDATFSGAGQVGLLSLSPITAATNAAFDNFVVSGSGPTTGAAGAATAATGTAPGSAAGTSTGIKAGGIKVPPASSGSTATGGGGGSLAGNLPEIEDAAMFNDAGGRPGARQSLFDVGNQRVYVVLEMNGSTNAQFRAQWKAIRGTEEFDLTKSEHANSGNSRRVWLYAQRDWSAGLYRVDVYANDQLLTQVEFSVY